jgi:hypothetical protein
LDFIKLVPLARGSKGFEMQSFGDNFKENCIIKQSVTRKKKTFFIESSRPSATTFHVFNGVATRHDNFTNKGVTFYLD